MAKNLDFSQLIKIRSVGFFVGRYINSLKSEWKDCTLLYSNFYINDWRYEISNINSSVARKEIGRNNYLTSINN